MQGSRNRCRGSDQRLDLATMLGPVTDEVLHLSPLTGPALKLPGVVGPALRSDRTGRVEPLEGGQDTGLHR